MRLSRPELKLIQLGSLFCHEANVARLSRAPALVFLPQSTFHLRPNTNDGNPAERDTAKLLTLCGFTFLLKLGHL